MPQHLLRQMASLGTLTVVSLVSCKSKRPSAMPATSLAESSSTATQAPPSAPSMPGHIRLRVLPSIAKGVEALPRVVPNENVTPEQAARLNAVFDRYDRESRKSIHDCKEAVRDMHEEALGEVYSNDITVLMRGPRYLSILVHEFYDECGGPHPNDNFTSLVYDVTTGQRLNLVKTLPGSHASNSVDPADTDFVTWLPMQKAAQRQAQEAAQKDTEPEDDCRPTYQEKDMAFVVWLDAGDGTINGYPAGLPHITSATCGEEVAIDLPTARTLGVSPEIISELQSAHTAAQQEAAAKKAAK